MYGFVLAMHATLRWRSKLCHTEKQRLGYPWLS